MSAVRSALVTFGGGLLVVAGLVGMFLPLPGFALIVLGLSMLSTRFTIARRGLDVVHGAIARLRPRA